MMVYRQPKEWLMISAISEIFKFFFALGIMIVSIMVLLMVGFVYVVPAIIIAMCALGIIPTR
jgi:hypothetical protein